jgi:hypothetical protein
VSNWWTITRTRKRGLTDAEFKPFHGHSSRSIPIA